MVGMNLYLPNFVGFVCSGTERIRATRPPASTQLFQNQMETPKTTIHQSEFGAKKSERMQPTRPRTSDLWKVGAKIVLKWGRK
jgi:hypothetical protein